MISDAGQAGSGRAQQANASDTARARKDVEGRGAEGAVGGGAQKAPVGDTLAVSESARAQSSRASDEESNNSLMGGFAVAEKNGASSLKAETPKEAADNAQKQAVFAPLKAVGTQANVDSGRALQLLG